MIISLFVVIALIWLTFATICDIKTREIPDWLNYSLIAIGLGLRFIFSFSDGFNLFLYGLLGVGISFLFGSAMYYGRQWGGGDVKLLMGMGAMFGSNIGFDIEIPFFPALIINVFIIGAVTGILYAVVLAIVHRKEFIKEFKKLNLKIIYFSLGFVTILMILGLFMNSILITLFFSITTLFFTSLYLLMGAVEKSCMYKFVNVNRLTEGDLLVRDILHKGKVIVSYKKPGLEKKDIESIKKLKFKTILIKEGIPFAPNFLIGFLILIFYGNLINFLW